MDQRRNRSCNECDDSKRNERFSLPDEREENQRNCKNRDNCSL